MGVLWKKMFIQKFSQTFRLAYLDTFFVVGRLFLDVIVARGVVIVVGREKVYVESSHGIRVQAGRIIGAGYVRDGRLHGA